MKKLLSLILIGAMLISIVPSVFAEEAASEVELELAYNYDFGAAGYGKTTEIGYDELKEYGDTDETDDNGDDQSKLAWATKNGTDPWIVDGHYRCTEDSAATPLLTGTDVGEDSNKQPNALHWRMRGTRAYQSVAKSGAAIVLQIKIDKPGIYVPEITYYAKNDLAQYDIYLAQYKHLKANYRYRLEFGNAALSGATLTALRDGLALLDNDEDVTFLGQVDMYSSSAGKVTKKIDTRYEITQEEIDKYGEQFCLYIFPNGINASAKKTGSNAKTQFINLFSFKLYTEKEEEETLDSEFTYEETEHTGGSTTLRAFAVYGTDGEVSETEIIETPAVTYGSTCTVSAPETVTKGEKTYNFLYWAKGATMEKKQIISHSAEFSYRPSEGANYIIAVYKEAGAETSESAEYYNANGQLLENGNALPSMAGYGQAIGWRDAGNGIFVAEYAPLEKNIEVTVNGEKETYVYGENVVCTASAPEGKVFMYWTKDGEIVTLDETYVFSAWKDCSVEAVYGDTAPSLGKTMRKIILGSFAGDSNSIMAEFIGFSDALEKGIMLGEKKYAMTTDKTQFSITNDIDETEICGYAIVREGGVLKMITDGGSND